MLLSPLDLESPIQRNTKPVKNGSRNSQTMSPKSVSFLIETPLQVTNKAKKATFTENLGENMKKYKLNLFASRSRCKMMFQALDNRGRPKLNSNIPKKPSENQLNITDSFQYRFESLLEEGDYVLDITQQKKSRQTPAPIGLMIPLHRKKRAEMKLEKTKLKARRKSDISLWSGGVSELENKTVFWTFEYISKPVQIIDTSFPFQNPANRGSERITPYHKSAGLGIPDGTPTRVSALARLDGTPSRLSGLARHDSTPISVGKKPLNSNMKAWSAKMLDLKKESSGDDKSSPFLIPVRPSAAKVNSINQSDVDSDDDSSVKSDLKLDKVTNPSVISSPYIHDPKTPVNFDSAINKLQTTFSTAVAGSNDNINFKPSSDQILSTHLIKSDSEQQFLRKPTAPLVIQPSKSQERFKPFKSGPSPLPVFIRDFSGVGKPQRPSPKITPGSVIIPRHRKNLSVGCATVDNSATSLKMSMTGNDSILINSNENSPRRAEGSHSKDTKKVKDFKRILEEHKSNRTKVLLKLQKKLVAKAYSPDSSFVIPNPSTKMTPESSTTKKSKIAKPTLKDKKSFFMDHISPNETVALPKVPTSRTQSVSWSFIKPPLATSNSKRSLETASKLKISGGHHRQSASVSINIESAKILKLDKPEKPAKEKEKSKMVKAPTKFKPKISQPKQLKTSYAPMNHLL